MKTGSIKQTVTFNAAPEKIYELIMNAKKHSTFTGADATMSSKVNGKFSAYDGYIHGYNIELIKGQKIVQAWHFAEDGWPDDHYSICTFTFEEINNKTKLTFSQTGVPEHKVKALTNGWKQYYWKPMKEYLENN